ncbi:amino acid permease [Actinoplanes xinjiangensis]|uniref:amino acid permease n=1 Tax=Actinoplanes xinjiangensis TaxID=512350 RepID=UPI003414AE21
MSQPERKLGTWPIFVIAVSAMTPLTVVAGALPLGYGEVEEKGIPVAYMLVAAVLGVFAVGLAAMARHVPNSGAFYSYASIGISRPVGVGTAFVALVAYNAMQIGLYGAFGVAAHNALSIFGIDVSWIICALIGWAVIAFLGRLDLDLNARILTVLVCAEVLVVLVFDAVMLGNPYGGTITFDTLNPGLIATAGGVSLLVAAIAGMVGFEAPLVYAAEARDPRRTIARAIGFTLLVAAFLYGGTAWAMSVVAGPDNIVAIAGQHLDDLFFFLPEPYLPAVLVDLGRIFFATSLFAAMLAFHHTVARYALTVAREGVLPAGLARTRGGVPVAASTAQSVLALAVLIIFAIATWNPTTDLFFFGTVSGGLGVLVLMTVAAVAVVRFFRRDGHGETRWRRAIAPWIAVVFLSLVLLLTIAFFSVLLDTDNIAKIWSPILSFLAALVAGIIWGRKLRRERPEVYAVIGTGHPPLAPGESPPPVITDASTAADSPTAADTSTVADASTAADGSTTAGAAATAAGAATAGSANAGAATATAGAPATTSAPPVVGKVEPATGAGTAEPTASRTADDSTTTTKTDGPPAPAVDGVADQPATSANPTPDTVREPAGGRTSTRPEGNTETSTTVATDSDGNTADVGPAGTADAALTDPVRPAADRDDATTESETTSGGQDPAETPNPDGGTPEALRPAPSPRKRTSARTSTRRPAATTATPADQTSDTPPSGDAVTENGSTADPESPAANPRPARRPAPRPRRPQASDTAAPAEPDTTE